MLNIRSPSHFSKVSAWYAFDCTRYCNLVFTSSLGFYHRNVNNTPSLFLTDSPEVSVTPISQVTEGQNVSLNCSVTGNPPPNVAWIRGTNNSVIVNSGTTVLTNIRRTDSGFFQCLAWNQIGANASANLSIDVLCEYWGIRKIIQVMAA